MSAPVLKVTAEQCPITIVLVKANEVREYVLIATKQGKLLLNAKQ